MNAMSDQDRPKKLALLMEDTIVGRAFGGGFNALAKEFGYSFAVDEPMAVGAKDYSSQILKFKNRGIDGIILFSANTDAVTFVRQMKEVGLNAKYLHGFKGTWPQEFYKALGTDAENIILDGFWSEDFPYPGAKELGTRFAKQFGKHSVSIGLYYALCQILWEAIEIAGTLDSADIKAAVLNNTFKGTVMGDVDYDNQTGIATHLSCAYQWDKGYQQLIYPSSDGGWKTKAMLPWDKR
jgi:branched-chain amino acid transport system substrate-binding protein